MYIKIKYHRKRSKILTLQRIKDIQNKFKDSIINLKRKPC